MTHMHTKAQVQRSVGSKDRVETNGETTKCSTFPANADSNHCNS